MVQAKMGTVTNLHKYNYKMYIHECLHIPQYQNTRGQTSDKISLNQLKARISHAVRECHIIQFVREYQKLPPPIFKDFLVKTARNSVF